MIRFRIGEDERRYLLLRAELHLRLSQSGVSIPVLADVLRNLGKIESFVYAEGIRQGAAAAVIAFDETASGLALHRDVYGSADTPLRVVEKEKWGQTDASGVFEEEPLEFSPLTLAEAKVAYREQVQKELETSLDAPSDPEEFHGAKDAGYEAQRRSEASIPSDDEPWSPNAEDLRRARDAVAVDSPNEHLYDVASPDFLDRVRDELIAAKQGGLEAFTEYADLIYHLHMKFGVDAGALDLQLGTSEGRAVLDQAGYFEFPPGGAWDMTMFLDQIPENIVLKPGS